MKRLVSYTLALGLVFVILGCGGSTPVVSIDNSQYFTKSEEINKIEAAIKLGAMKKAWTTKKVNKNLLEASINVKEKYLVEVLISYNNKGYKIDYKYSSNLNYNSTKNTIHNNYNRWIHGLSKSIDDTLVNIDTLTINKIDLQGETVYIKPNSLYKSDISIRENIKSKCSIDKEVVTNIVRYSKNSDIDIIINEEVPDNALELKITVDAIKEIENTMGYRRSIVFSGEIVQNNVKYSSFLASRTSVAGVWSNNDSLDKDQVSCKFFTYINKNISKDISAWLSNPVDNMVLGDGKL